MKRLFALLLAVISVTGVSGQSLALPPGLYEAESSTLLPAYAGSGWTEVTDGDYVVMETAEEGDSVSFQVSGSQLVIYRELLSVGGGTAEICVNALCNTFTNASSVNQRSAPVAFPVSDGSTITITNTDGGILRLDSFLILAGSLLATEEAPDPAYAYHVLSDGTLARTDQVITGGEVILIAEGGAIIVLLIALLVVLAWKR